MNRHRRPGSLTASLCGFREGGGNVKLFVLCSNVLECLTTDVCIEEYGWVCVRACVRACVRVCVMNSENG